MTYADLYQFLTEAERRVANHPDAEVRERSAETVALCEQRMADENIDRDTLEVLAKVDRRVAEYKRTGVFG